MVTADVDGRHALNKAQVVFRILSVSALMWLWEVKPESKVPSYELLMFFVLHKLTRVFNTRLIFSIGIRAARVAGKRPTATAGGQSLFAFVGCISRLTDE